MRKLYLLLVLMPFIFGSCSNEEESVGEYIVTVNNRTAEIESHQSFSINMNSETQYTTIYIYKGEVEITDDLLQNPDRAPYRASVGNFVSTLPKGKYTVIVETVVFQNDNPIPYYEGVAYTTINYPSDNLSTDFAFDFNREDIYTIDNITYVKL